MKLLLDTNIFIPLEPSRAQDLEQSTESALRLTRLCVQQGVSYYLHPDISEEVGGDRDELRRDLRQVQLGRYPILESPPTTSIKIERTLGVAPPGSHNWYDNRLLAALDANAVDFLVTEDRQVHRKAEHLGLGEKILTIPDAISLVSSLFDSVPEPPPLVQSVKAYQLNSGDPIFNSLKEDYDGFDQWLNKCKREHRNTWVIGDLASGLKGIAIINQEDTIDFGITGKILKLCTFKVGENSGGFRLGELLLKTVFGFAKENSYSHIFLTVFEKHGQLLNLLETFGFEAYETRNERGELTYIKKLCFDQSELNSLDAFAFNKKFGPFAIKLSDTPAYAIPIQPQFHDLLFPEIELGRERSLFTTSLPFGNSIRKAYLTGSNLSQLTQGGNILFYVSGYQVVRTLGVVESAERFTDTDKIVSYVGNRTVYNLNQIRQFAARKRGVMVILFRQSITLDIPLTLSDLIRVKVLNGPPQSIVTVGDTGREWLVNNLPNK